MFQTPAAVSTLDLLLPEGKPSAGRSPAEPGAFGQEFDKQVKNINKQGQGERLEKTPQDARQAQTKASSDAAQQEAPTTQAQDDVHQDVEGGNILPLPDVVDLELAAEPLAQAPLPIPVDEQPRLELLELVVEDGDTALPLVTVAPLQPELNRERGLAAWMENQGDDDGPRLVRDFMRQRHLAAVVGKDGLEQPVKQEVRDFVLEMTSAKMPVRSIPTVEGLPASAALVGPGSSPAPVAQPGSLPAAMSLVHPMQQKGWDMAMGQRVVWMVRHNVQEAQIQLNPRELGPIQVRVSVSNEQANVHFVAQHATTREALEAAMPRLRDMLNESGLNLAQSDVSQHAPGQGREGGGGLSSTSARVIPCWRMT